MKVVLGYLLLGSWAAFLNLRHNRQIMTFNSRLPPAIGALTGHQNLPKQRTLNALSSRKSGLVIYALIFSLLGFTQNACGQQPFTASGTIQSEFLDVKGAPTHRENYSFEVAVSNCLWSIKLTPLSATGFWDNASNFVCISHEASFDGQNIYYINDMSRLVQTKKEAGGAVGNSVATAIVVKDRVPHYPFAEGIGAIWLTYASSCYFTGKTNGDIEPMFGTSDSIVLPDQVVFAKASWHLNDTLLVPDKLTVYNDGTVLTFQNLVTPQPMRYRPPYDKGFAIAQFRVQSHTNVGKIALPTSAQLTVFGTKVQPLSNTDLRVVVTHQISCARVSNQASVNVRPPSVPGDTVVTDSRFLGERVIAFGYHVNNRLLTDSEVRELPEYKRAKKVGWITPKGFNFNIVADFGPEAVRKRRLFIGVLTVIMIVPLFFFFRERRESKKHNTNKN